MPVKICVTCRNRVFKNQNACSECLGRTYEEISDEEYSLRTKQADKSVDGILIIGLIVMLIWAISLFKR